MNELIEIKKSYMSDGIETNTVNARELSVKLGVQKKFADWIKDQIVRARLVEGQDFIKVPEKVALSRTGQTMIEYYLTLDAAKHIAMVSGSEKGYEIRQYFIDFEKTHKQIPQPQFQIPQTFSEALRLAADAHEKLLIAEHSRDEAIRTKAQVAAGREGTLFSKNGALTKKVQKLEEQLGINGDFLAVKAIPWLSEYFRLRLPGTWQSIGHQLKILSIDLGQPILKVDDPRWGQVNTYHKDVIFGFKHLLDEDYNWMQKYRRYDRI